MQDFSNHLVSLKFIYCKLLTFRSASIFECHAHISISNQQPMNRTKFCLKPRPFKRMLICLHF